MSNEPPVRRMWNRVKDRAPRQKVITTVTASVRRKKPQDATAARTLLIDEAAKQGVTDLSEKELKVMVDAVVTSAKDAATQAVSKGAATVRSMWSNLQTSSPQWIELPDDVAALSIRSDQVAVDVAVTVSAAGVLAKLVDTVSTDSNGVRTFEAWLSADGDAAVVHVGAEVLGVVPEPSATTVREVLRGRRGWVPAAVRRDERAELVVTVELPDRP